MFNDLEDLTEDFPELVKRLVQRHQPVPGRTTYRHTSSGRRYVVKSASSSSVILESISGHVRDLHPSMLATSEMWELVTA